MHCVLASSVHTAVCEVSRFGLGGKVGQDSGAAFRRSIGPLGTIRLYSPTNVGFVPEKNA